MYLFFTEVGCKTNMSKQCIIVRYLGRTAFDDDRAAGGWNGVVRFRVGSGLGLGLGFGEGRGEGEGEGSGNRSILDCSNMMTVLFVHCAKQSCFVKAYYRPFVIVIVHRGWLQNKHVETVHYRWVFGKNRSR